MRIAIVHNSVDATSRVEDQDVMTQVAAVSQALSKLGHVPVVLACTLDLNHMKNELMWIQPDLVFYSHLFNRFSERAQSVVCTLAQLSRVHRSI